CARSDGYDDFDYW
nr:immunoglobulin heavy chain junction region [Mus musculus]MBK4184958.1 immunoglobulin heavy chain junction region [Mus musculus]MBK4196424.1 immunoglobulin heavy chain junction region [Mus musculus]